MCTRGRWYFFIFSLLHRSVYSQDPADLKLRQRPLVGQEVAVQSGAAWLRGKVEGLIPEERVAQVFMTDLAWTHEFPGKAVWNLPDDLSAYRVPPAVSKYRLENVSSAVM